MPPAPPSFAKRGGGPLCEGIPRGRETCAATRSESARSENRVRNDSSSGFGEAALQKEKGALEEAEAECGEEERSGKGQQGHTDLAA